MARLGVDMLCTDDPIGLARTPAAVIGAPLGTH
jgi:hypothetical protein